MTTPKPPRRMGRPPLSAKKDLCLKLRSEGKSLNEIMDLMPGTAKSTLAAWIKNAERDGAMPAVLPANTEVLDDKAGLVRAKRRIAELDAEMRQLELDEEREELIRADAVVEMLRSLNDKFPPFMENLLSGLTDEKRNEFIAAGEEYSAAISREFNLINRRLEAKKGKA